MDGKKENAMIYAIAIYNVAAPLQDGFFQKILSEQKGSSVQYLFDPFNGVNESLALFLEVQGRASKIYDIKSKDRYHYLQQISHDRVIAIVSKNPLDPMERVYLFKNTEHVYNAFKKAEQSGDTSTNLKITLADIIKNPCGYTGKDVLIEGVKEGVEKVKEEALKAVDSLLMRQEGLEKTLEQAERLAIESESFNREATKLNACCKW